MSGGWRSIARGDVVTDSRRGNFRDFKVLFRLVSYGRHYKGLVLLGSVMMLIYIITVVATPWIIQLGLEEIIEKGNRSGLEFIVMIFFGNVLINYIAHYLSLIHI